MTFFAHRGLTRFVLSGKNPGEDITEVVEEHFGVGAKKVIGKAMIAMMISGIKPPTPALIGRNSTPAPIAVPYRPSIHMVSDLRQAVAEPEVEVIVLV